MSGKYGKATRLITKFRIGEISLVPEGDNPGAGVLIMKRRERPLSRFFVDILKARVTAASVAAGQLIDLSAGAEGPEGVDTATRILKGMNMDVEQLAEKLGQIEGDLETITKARDEAVARADASDAEVARLTAELEKAKAEAPEAGEDSEEEILKALPEPIRARLAAAEKAANEATALIEKQRDDTELQVQIDKARPLVGEERAKVVGGLLHRIEKGKTTADDAAALVDLIKSAATVNEQGKALFTAIGKARGGDANAGEAQAKLDEAIVNIQKAKPTLSREAAYAEALEANPDLYEQLRTVRPGA